MLPESIRIGPPPFDPIAAFGIGFIAVCVAALWVVLVSRRNMSRALLLTFGVTLVMALSAVAASSGRLSRFDTVPPPMMVMIAGVLVMSFGIGVTPFGRRVSSDVSLAALVGLQSFRLPLELVMHHAGTVGIMPPELSYSGYSFDIVTGASALVLFVLLRRGVNVPTSVVWAWNVWGSLCLLVILVVAIASSPIVRLFGDDPRHLNTWVLFFPYVWLPVVLVTVAMSSHFIVTRQLLLRTNHRDAGARRRLI